MDRSESTPRRRASWPLLPALACSLLASTARAGDAPRLQVVLIGVEETPGSDAAAQAVDRLAKTLAREDGSHQVLRFDGATRGRPPTLEALRKQAARALENLSATDRALVYYRGRVIEDGGKVYLAVDGTDPDRLGATALPLEELRRWLDEDDGDSEALLVLDAPGAEAASGPGARHHIIARADSGDLGGLLASGLAGDADVSGDATITLPEFHEWLRGRSRVDPIRFDPPSGPDGGLDEVATLAPRRLDDALGELTAWADDQARRDSASAIDVRPFGFKGQVDTTRASLSLAGELASALRRKASRPDWVTGPIARSAPASENSSSHILTGTYQRLTDPDRLLVQVELARKGARGVTRKATRLVVVDDNVRMQVFGDEGLRNMLAFLQSDDCPVRVEIVCEGRPGPVPFEDDGQQGVRVRVPRGAIYKVRVTNRTPGRVMARLLIDGVNTVVQNDGDADVSPCLLEHARGYVIEPKATSAFEGWVVKVGAAGRVDPFQFVPFGQSKAIAMKAGGESGVILLAFYREPDERDKEGRLAMKGARNANALGTAAAPPIQRNIPVSQPMRFNPNPILALKIAYEADESPDRVVRRP